MKIIKIIGVIMKIIRINAGIINRNALIRESFHALNRKVIN